MRHHRQRIVERHDRADDADWESEVIADAIFRSRPAVERQRLAREAAPFLGRLAQDGRGARRLATRLANRLAPFTRDGARVFLLPRLDAIRSRRQHRTPRVQRKIDCQNVPA